MKTSILDKAGYFLYNWERFTSRAKAEYQKKEISKYTEAPSLAGPGYITGHAKLEISKNVHIGRNFFIRANGGLSIGANTHISHQLTVYTINHDYNGALLPYDSNYISRPVHIGENVWIGFGVTILPGCRIGDGAIIGAGSVLTGDIGKGSIVGAPPASEFKRRSLKHYDTLVEAQAFSGHGGHPINNNSVGK